MNQHAWEAAASVLDPELPCVTVAELGILRGVDVTGKVATATVTPTYSGCPAVAVIESDIADALRGAGFEARIERVLTPAWTTDWITDEGRQKLSSAGIAPPACLSNNTHTVSFFSRAAPTCPNCGAKTTSLISQFGSTACKAQYACDACQEPFDYFKVL